MQHTNHRAGGRSVAGEATTTDLLFNSQKAQMWERWKEGWMLQEIGKLFNRPHTSIQKIFSQSGAFGHPTGAAQRMH